jgi:hypothetical protein
MNEYTLDNVPADPVHQMNYSELLLLWKDQEQKSENGIRETAEEFWAWDAKVTALLTPRERAFYLEPHLKHLDPTDTDIARVNRLNHLTKILWYRQGVRTSNGFNG